MPIKKPRKFIFALCLLGMSSQLLAAPYDEGPFPSYVTFGAGAFNFHKPGTTFQTQIEFRYKPRFKIPAPLIGFTADHLGMTYLFAGFVIDMYLSDTIVLTPAFAAGYYNRGGSKDLGYPLEFRSAIELSYQFKDRARLTLQLYHLSNAGLSDRRNPGEESLLLIYQLPVGRR